MRNKLSCFYKHRLHDEYNIHRGDGETRNVLKILVGKYLEKCRLERLRRIWGDTIMTYTMKSSLSRAGVMTWLTIIPNRRQW
jgi:hypothetical protein